LTNIFRCGKIQVLQKKEEFYMSESGFKRAMLRRHPSYRIKGNIIYLNVSVAQAGDRMDNGEHIYIWRRGQDYPNPVDTIITLLSKPTQTTVEYFHPSGKSTVNLDKDGGELIIIIGTY
jgi:hypothetical protein